MIRRRFFASLLSVTGAFAFISCGSTPQEEPAPVQEEVIVEEVPQVVEETVVEVKDNSEAYLAALADAKAKKERIDREGFASYDQKSYDNGAQLLEGLSGADPVVLPGDNQLKQAQEASASFDAVLKAAFKSLAKDARKKAVAAKKDADSVKAAVSRKADYDSAVKLVKDGDSQFVTGGAEQAVTSYEKAAASFTSLYEDIFERRAKAQKAIEEAKKRVAESESNAVAADDEFPLGDKAVEGIVDENTQLLEADDFTSQENAAVVLSDDIAEEAGEEK